MYVAQRLELEEYAQAILIRCGVNATVQAGLQMLSKASSQNVRRP